MGSWLVISASGEENPMAGLLHHVQDVDYGLLFSIGGTEFHLSKHLVMLWAAAGLVLAAFSFLALRRRGRPEDPFPKGRIENLVEAFLVFIRDELVRPNVEPHAADRLLPFFVTLFCLILACNLLGMVPGAATATGNIAVTLGLAALTFAVGVVAGMAHQGPVRFVKNLVPHGLPVFVLPLLFPIEIMGLLIKHVALAIRLFANMIAGHIVISAFLLLVALFRSLAIAPVSVAAAVGISFLEIFVAFLQAYVFTLLSSLFVGMAVHPEH